MSSQNSSTVVKSDSGKFSVEAFASDSVAGLYVMSPAGCVGLVASGSGDPYLCFHKARNGVYETGLPTLAVTGDIVQVRSGDNVMKATQIPLAKLLETIASVEA